MNARARATLGLVLTGAIAATAGCSTAGGRSRMRSPRAPELTDKAEIAAEAEAVASLRVRARESVAGSIRRTGERLGRPDPDPGAVRVEFEKDGVGRTACGGNTIACTSGHGDSVEIELCAEFFLSGEMNLELTARHEGVHAYFRRQLGRRQYRNIPPWFQEGLAIHLAGQTQEKVVELLFEEPETPEAELAGLEAEESYEHYFEYALALQFLDGFPGGVDAVLGRILDGADAYEAIQAVTGLEHAAFVLAARRDAGSRLRSLIDGMPELYREGVALVPRDRNKDIHGAMERFERVLAAAGIDLARGVEPGDLTEEAGLAPVFALARWATFAALYSNRLPEAISALRLLLTLPPHRRGERTHSLRLDLARALEKQGRLDEALLEYGRLARLHHESPWYQNTATWSIARILFSLGRHEEALEWIEGYPEPGIHADKEMAYLKGLTLFQLGRVDEAIGALRRIAVGDDKDAWVQKARKAIADIESGSLPSR